MIWRMVYREPEQQRFLYIRKCNRGDVSKKLDKLNKLIDKYYLYQDEVDQDALVEGIYSGYAAALGDPYTVYYNKDETKALMESTSGTFSGGGGAALYVGHNSPTRAARSWPALVSR